MEKPWFTLENGTLVEHNVPVPPPPLPAGTLDGGIRRQGLQAIYGIVHRTPAGTALAAQRIADALEARHIPPR